MGETSQRADETARSHAPQSALGTSRVQQKTTRVAQLSSNCSAIDASESFGFCGTS
jgi:hypothetical protein